MASGNIRWFGRLVASETSQGQALLEKCTRQELDNKRIVAFEYASRGNVSRKYVVFNDHFDLFRYIQEQGFDARRYHEVCLNGSYQKPHFDIDIDGNNHPDTDIVALGEKIVETLLQALIDFFQEEKISFDLNNVIMATSHNSYKQSYHIILDKMVHYNHHEAKAFYNKVVAKVPETEREIVEKCVDASIYSPNHLFRLTGCHKYGDARVKKVEPNFTFKGQIYQRQYEIEPSSPQHREFLDFTASLICFCSGCEFLPSWYQPIKMADSGVEPCPEDCQRGLQLIADVHGVSVSDLGLEFSKCRGATVYLQRVAPSYCINCKRTHENMSALMVIREGLVYYTCCRPPSTKMKLIGSIGPGQTATDLAAWFQRTAGQSQKIQAEIPQALIDEYSKPYLPKKKSIKVHHPKTPVRDIYRSGQETIDEGPKLSLVETMASLRRSRKNYEQEETIYDSLSPSNPKDYLERRFI